MSFFGNNSRPDLLKNNGEESERTPRGSESRFGDAPPAPEPVPSFGADSRSSFSAAAGSSSPGTTPTPPEQCTNVVGTGARWKGALKVDESVRVDGIFSGEIEAKGTVYVSEGAEVDAKIHSTFVVIAGSFRGEVRADQKAELLPSSQVAGEIITKAFSVQEGATFDGGVQMTGETARTTNNSSRGNNRNGASADSDAPTASERRNNRSEASSGASNS